jgi:hypothetical protein
VEAEERELARKEREKKRAAQEKAAAAAAEKVGVSLCVSL